MAHMARHDQQNRTVTVKRQELLKQLQENREKHVREYEAAKEGYKSLLTKKLDKAYEKAKESIDKEYKKLRTEITEMTESDIEQQQDWFTLMSEVSVELKVPRSFAEDYDAAIAMVSWDTRPELELTHAEFTCFVRDKWDWKSGFEAVSTQYIGKTGR